MSPETDPRQPTSGSVARSAPRSRRRGDEVRRRRDMAALAEAGIEVVGENRAQDLEAKHAAYGDAFRWHFIGHLQSRKAKVVNELCELVHSLDSRVGRAPADDPRARRGQPLGRGERSPASRRSELEAFLELYDDVRGLMTMPPQTDDPEASRPYFRRLRELAESATACSELSMGTSQDYRVAAEEGATHRARGIRPVRGITSANHGIRQTVWSRTLVYFGIAEEDDELGRGRLPHEEDLERTYSERPNVRRLTPRRRQRRFRRLDRPRAGRRQPRPPGRRSPRPRRRPPRRARLEPVARAPSVQVHLVVPRSFNDAQQIADRSRTRCR